MAKKTKKGNDKAKVAARAKGSEPKQGPKPNGKAPDLDALRKPVLGANAGPTKAETEAKALVDKGLALLSRHLCRRYHRQRQVRACSWVGVIEP
jgi:hypothetical protein